MMAYHKPVTNKVLDQAEQAIDEEFGDWLRMKRTKLKLTYQAARDITGIPTKRIVELESGSGKGITRKELRIFQDAYLLDMTEMLARAEGRII